VGARASGVTSESLRLCKRDAQKKSLQQLQQMMELSGNEQTVILNFGLSAGSCSYRSRKAEQYSSSKMCKFDLLLALVANAAVKQQ